MASPSRPRVEFTPASINKVLELPPYQPNSQISSAIGLLTGTGEGDVDQKNISIIPVDLSGHNSVLIRFKKPVMPYVPKAKGLDNHELRIQRLSDTDPRTEELDRASLDGFDTGHDALIASMNNVRQTYFSTSDVLPSPQLIRVQAQNGDMVEIPLYVPIIFFGPTGKKSVAVVTRFPREYIAVEASKSLDKPIGIVPADENKIIRQPATSAPTQTFAWAFPKDQPPVVNEESAIPIPTIAVDGNPGVVKIDFDTLERERVAKIPLENIISGIDRAKSTREAKRLLRVLNNVEATSHQCREAFEKWKQESRFVQLKLDDPTRLFGEIAENVVGYQEIFDKAERINGGWLSYASGGLLELFAYSWRVDVEAVNRTLEKHLRLYQKRDNPDRRKHYVEYASLKHLLDSEWIAEKRWKN